MRPIIAAMLGIAFVLATCVGVDAATVYVDSSNTGGPWDGTGANPFNKIQDGIDAAAAGDTVLVADGTYNENINFYGKGIAVKSISGPHNTIIDGGQNASVVTFNSNEDTLSVISGFAITNGRYGTGGGVRCELNSSATIEDNIIKDNYASGNGGGIYCSDNTQTIIRDNIIEGNTLSGIFVNRGQQRITGNIIRNNTAWNGGGINAWYSQAMIANNLIVNNTADSRGGGILSAQFDSNEPIQLCNNTIVGNSAPTGGGICFWWGAKSEPVVKNCVIWGNNSQISGGATVMYSDIQGGGSGEGNIDADPLFVNPDNGDYHLQASSPCIDVGDPSSPLDPDGTRADMGALYYDQSTPPEITSVSPSSGSTDGGTSVTITGSNFGSAQGTGGVTFGGTEATSYTSWSDTLIVCVTPVHAAGAVDVVVTAGNGLSDTESDGFLYVEIITVNLPGGAIMTMVWIPPGTFMMGSPDTDDMADASEKPQHEVTITRGFYLGKYELTQGQWESVMGTLPWDGQDMVQNNTDNPAVYISWDDVRAFIDVLNAAEGDSVWRLPTEAEWEYACRAGTTTQWSFGDDESRFGQYAWYRDNAWDVGEQYAHAVGTKLPNPWGLYDMHGNVYEWCQDWYGAYLTNPQIDPTGRKDEPGRVIRGSTFMENVLSGRSAHRGRALPTFRIYFTGTRLLRQAEGVTISSLSPTSGPTSGRTSVTISGSYFGGSRGNGSVTFGGTAATSYTSWSDTQIVCVTPAHAAGVVDVVATSAFGLIRTKPSAFTYIPLSQPSDMFSVTQVTDGSKSFYEPVIAIDPLGTVHIVCRGDDGIYYIRGNRSGSFSIPERIAASGSTPDIDVSEDGRVHIVYWGYDGEDHEIYYTYEIADGEFSTPVNVTDNTSYEARPKIAVDKTGNVHLIYYQAFNKLYYVSKAIDSDFGPSILCGGPDNSMRFSIAAGGDGTVSISYSSDAAVYYTRKAIGGDFDAPVVVSNNSELKAETNIATDSSGTVHIVYNEGPLVANELLYYVTRSPDGSFTTPVNVTDRVEGAYQPYIAVDGSQAVHLMCVRSDGDNEIYYFNKPIRDDFREIAKLTDNTRHDGPTSLAVDDSGNVHIAFYSTSTIFYATNNFDVVAPSPPMDLFASPGNSQVSLAWVPNVERDLSHYIIHRTCIIHKLSVQAFMLLIDNNLGYACILNRVLRPEIQNALLHKSKEEFCPNL